jgi:hypothetical protein
MGGIPGIENAKQRFFEYTSTKSIFTFDIDGIELVATFMSPITPKDLKLQSLVFSYLNVEVRSTDGREHQVELYSDISAGKGPLLESFALLIEAEWAAGQRDTEMRWNSGSLNNVAYHAIWKHEQLEFSEGGRGPAWNELANWGTIYYGTGTSPSQTFQTGSDRDVRGAFISRGRLNNTTDTRWRSVENDWPVFAFAKALGLVGKSKQNMLFSIGLTQDNAIQFLGKSDKFQRLPSLWTHYWRSGSEAVRFTSHCNRRS